MVRRFSISALLAVALLLLASCGEHSFLNEIFGEASSSSNGGDNTQVIVEPLIQTKWSQSVPYNSMSPVVEGGNPIPGCDVIAAAQIMKYHRHPARGAGQSEPYTMETCRIYVPLVNLNVVYDWDNMLNTYTSNFTELQKNAVATLVYHIGVIGKKDFSTGYHNTNWIGYPVMLTTIYGYDRSIQSHSRSYYDDIAWEALIRAQLDTGLPVFYWGNNQTNTTPHTFIIDGYDNTDKFHINWGWGGQSDGWYSLKALNPGNSDFNYNQNIYINIKPDEGSTGSNEFALGTFTVSKTSISQSELFTATPNITSFGFFPGGQVGAALIDNNGRIVAVIGSRNMGNNWQPGSKFAMEMNCFIPETVNPGQYRLMTVTRLEGGDWKIVTLSAVRDGVPNAINITVTAGEANGGGYGMGLLGFTASKTTVSRNEKFDVGYQFLNVGTDAFNGQTGVALVDNNNNIVEVIRSWNTGNYVIGARNSNPVRVTCTMPSTVAPGQYRLRMVTRPEGGEWRIATISVDNSPTSIGFEVK
jgi:hypothetical protein